LIHPGLCAACVHARVITSGKGSHFWLCELSRVDPAFPRYPPLPVVRCSGFERKQASAGSDSSDD
jgi:hypothetical protein